MSMNATYSPEDNKLRLYSLSRLSSEDYARVKAAGFKWAPKQELFVAPMWTPGREDLLLELCGEIGDEDYSPEERAADRAERFAGYRDKRRDEAGGLADTFEAGPSAFGHQNRQRAERQAARHDRYRVNAVSQWSKAEYWQERTAGVISHALHKSSAPVRRGRLLRLEAEQRKHLESLSESQRRYDAWKAILTMEGADELLPDDLAVMNKAQRVAYTLASVGSWWNAYHPTNEAANEKAREIWKHGFSAYDFLTKTEFIGIPFERLTPRQLAELYLASICDPSEDDRVNRWSRHYELRICYEKAMLENEGGMAAEVAIEPGGWIRAGRSPEWRQIQKVNKSPATGRVVSVQVWGTYTGYTKESGYTKQETRPCLVTCNIERQGEDCYRAPTDDERKQFAEQKKASKKPPVSIINPTDEDAERLQALLNSRTTSKPRQVDRTTQAYFSRNSGGDGVYYVCEYSAGDVVFKCRMRRRGFVDYSAAESVVVLTDKPQKQIPAAYWAAIDKPETKEQKTLAFS